MNHEKYDPIMLYSNNSTAKTACSSCVFFFKSNCFARNNISFKILSKIFYLFGRLKNKFRAVNFEAANAAWKQQFALHDSLSSPFLGKKPRVAGKYHCVFIVQHAN